MTATSTQQPACVDHLVVLAADLASGVEWCARTLGITPTAGGEHPLMGTHNRIFNISSLAHPRAYLEIIAINPEAAGARQTGAGGLKRWFDMDDEALRAQLRRHGPRLIHWVARVPDVQDAAARLAMLEIDRGEVLRANRMTPAGLLEWQITVRPDGRRLFDGCLPTLIEWAGVHPATDMPPSGLTLRSLTLRHPRAAALGEACTAVGLADVAIAPDVHASIDAVLATPRGEVVLSSAEGG